MGIHNNAALGFSAALGDKSRIQGLKSPIGTS
jgi:hypothetical protein